MIHERRFDQAAIEREIFRISVPEFPQEDVLDRLPGLLIF